jgi:hypothetical protein
MKMLYFLKLDQSNSNYAIIFHGNKLLLSTIFIHSCFNQSYSVTEQDLKINLIKVLPDPMVQ